MTDAEVLLPTWFVVTVGLLVAAVLVLSWLIWREHRRGGA